VEHISGQIAAMVGLGVGAQWIASRVGLPSILLLLVFGFIGGPAVLGWIRPDDLFGDLLFPFVSISVALILYEGGLTLRLRDLPGVRGVVRNLCTIGAAATWAVAALAAYLCFEVSVTLSILVGAILVVTGPTVIGPLVRHIRPAGSTGPILLWEGIVIDPIGAVLAVLVYELSVHATGAEAAASQTAILLARVLVFGAGLGVLSAAVLTLMLHRHFVPEFLQNAISLGIVVVTFVGANAMQQESGLLAVTVMGIALANQRFVDVKHIVEFKENLRVLLISTLFVVLSARVAVQDVTALGWGAVLFVALLVLVARPLCVLSSTAGSSLRWRERVFLMWVAPRGIVAAAVASLFALKLESAGFGGADVLVPITFVAIVGTVAVYGLTAPLAARWLGVADANPQGVLFIGAQAWVREVAKLLKEKKIPVLLVDTNRANIADARMAGLPTFAGSALAEGAVDAMNLGGIGRLVAATPNDWVNAMTAQRFAHLFGRQNCFQLPPRAGKPETAEAHRHLHGRWLFKRDMTHDALADLVRRGATVKATTLTAEFTYDDFVKLYGDRALPLFVLRPDGRLQTITADAPPKPARDQTIISLVRPEPQEAAPARSAAAAPAV